MAHRWPREGKVSIIPIPPTGPHEETRGLLQEGKMTCHFAAGPAALSLLLMEQKAECSWDALILEFRSSVPVMKREMVLAPCLRILAGGAHNTRARR